MAIAASPWIRWNLLARLTIDAPPGAPAGCTPHPPPALGPIRESHGSQALGERPRAAPGLARFVKYSRPWSQPGRDPRGGTRARSPPDPEPRRERRSQAGAFPQNGTPPGPVNLRKPQVEQALRNGSGGPSSFWAQRFARQAGSSCWRRAAVTSSAKLSANQPFTPAKVSDLASRLRVLPGDRLERRVRAEHARVEAGLARALRAPALQLEQPPLGAAVHAPARRGAAARSALRNRAVALLLARAPPRRAPRDRSAAGSARSRP